MLVKRLLLLFLVLYPWFVTAADTVTGSAGISYFEFKSGSDLTSRTVDIDGTYYLKSVQREDHPWREAAFLERAASLNVQIGEKRLSFRDSETRWEDLHYAVSGTYASRSNPLLVTLRYGESTEEDKGTSAGKFDEENYGVSLGFYLGESLAISGSFSERKREFNGNLIPENRRDDLTTYGLDLKYVQKLKQYQAIAMLLSINLDKYDFYEWAQNFETTRYLLDVTYYINPRIGFNGKYIYQDEESPRSDLKAYGVGVEGFITKNISLMLDYSTAESSDADTWRTGLEYWF